MLRKFEKYLKEVLLVRSAQSILVAVSGGMDSMVMLHLLNRLSLNLTVAHCNFGLRGDESNEDEEFVRLYAEKIGVPFFCKRFETALYVNINRISTQEAARNLRYQWFEKLISDNGFDFYTTGHNFDDRLETFFINAIRGSGVSGLRSIPVKNGNCIRPLMFATREEIAAYAENNSIIFREDSSNLKDDYTRNKVRHHLMPALQLMNLNFRKGLEKTLQNLGEAEAFIQTEINSRRDKLFQTNKEKVIIPIAGIKAERNSRFVLFELLKPFGFNASNVDNILTSINSEILSGKIFFSPKYELIINRNDLLIRPITRLEATNELLIRPEDHEIESPIRMVFENNEIGKDFRIDKGRKVAQIDYEKLKFPLKIRHFMAGDYFYPIGMGGKKLVSDFFTDEKMSLFQKRDAWILESDNQIVWIIGCRLDDRFKITSITKRVFKCRLI